MGFTKRDRNQMLALYPDNDTKQIDAVDGRDFIASSFQQNTFIIDGGDGDELPATLVNNATYFVVGTVTQTTDFTLGLNNKIVGQNAGNSAIVFTSGSNHISGTDFGFCLMRDIALVSASGAMFALVQSGLPPTAILSMKDSVIDATAFGTLTRLGQALFQNGRIQADNINIIGNSVPATATASISFMNMALLSKTDGGAVLSLGTQAFNNIEISSCLLAGTGASPSVLLSGTAGNVQPGEIAKINGNTFVNGTLSGVNGTTLGWILTENTGVNNSSSGTFWSVSANTTQTPLTQNTPTPILFDSGTFTLHSAERWSVSNAGLMTYLETLPVRYNVDVDVSGQKIGAGTDTISFQVWKNGSLVAGSRFPREFIGGGDIRPASLGCHVDMVTSDTLQVYAENETSGDDYEGETIIVRVTPIPSV